MKHTCVVLASLLTLISGCDAPVDEADAGMACASAESFDAHSEAIRRAASRVAELSSPPCASDADCVLAPMGFGGYECANGARLYACAGLGVHQDRAAEVEAIYREELEAICGLFPPTCAVSGSCHLNVEVAACVDSTCVSRFP